MRSRCSGMSLVETLVALLIVSFAVLAIVPMFACAKKLLVTSEDLASVGAAAVQRMELIRQIPFDTLTAGGSTTANVAGYFSTADPSTIVRWRITDDATPATLKTIRVRAVATRAMQVGRPKEITLAALVAQEP